MAQSRRLKRRPGPPAVPHHWGESDASDAAMRLDHLRRTLAALSNSEEVRAVRDAVRRAERERAEHQVRPTEGGRGPPN